MTNDKLTNDLLENITDIVSEEDRKTLTTRLIMYITTHDHQVWNDGYAKGIKRGKEVGMQIERMKIRHE